MPFAHTPGGAPFRRERQIRRLVKDAKDLPRKWESDTTPPTLTEDSWLTAVCFLAGVILLTGVVVLLVARFAQVNPHGLIAFGVAGLGAFFALIVFAWRQGSPTEKVHLIEVLLPLLVVGGIAIGLCIR